MTNHIPWFGIIVGLLPLQGNVVYSTKSHRFTVVGSSSVNNLTSLYIGTDKGYVIQVAHNFAFVRFLCTKIYYTILSEGNFTYITIYKAS